MKGFVVALSLTLLATPSLAGQHFPITGGPHGAEIGEQTCGPKGVIVGFTGQVGAWLDHIKMKCAQLLPAIPHGSIGHAGRHLGPRFVHQTKIGDSDGGHPFNFDCPPGSAVTSIYMKINNELKVIKYMEVACRAVISQQSVFPRGTIGDRGPYMAQYSETCPNDEFMYGLNARVWDYPVALGMRCEKVTLITSQ